MADFARRGFRLDRPESRAILETHARSFLTGFNLAAAPSRSQGSNRDRSQGGNRARKPHRNVYGDLHEALAAVPEPERGFAYEGAGMFARLTDLATGGATGSMRRLLSGPGARYVHLVHVGAGWGVAATRLPVTVPVPGTPLLRWLALDGAGFAETYFGGVKALHRRCVRRPQPDARAGAERVVRWQTRVSGCGRALWFVESASPQGLTQRIAEQPAAARPWLWSGVGLAAGYAGAVSAAELGDLGQAAGSAWPFFAQGVVFAVAARVLSGHVPAHTELASRTVLGVGPDVAATWSDVAADGLTDRRDVDAYGQWRCRLRAIVTELWR